MPKALQSQMCSEDGRSGDDPRLGIARCTAIDRVREFGRQYRVIDEVASLPADERRMLEVASGRDVNRVRIGSL